MVWTSIFTKRNTPWIIGGAAAIIAIIAIFFWGRSSKDSQPPALQLPNSGSGIPAGWSATPAANALYSAMKGFGTDEAAIWATLEPLTADQRAAVYNEFSNQFYSEYDCDLLCWFRGDLSGDQLSRALNYFSGVV